MFDGQPWKLKTKCYGRNSGGSDGDGMVGTGRRRWGKVALIALMEVMEVGDKFGDGGGNIANGYK